MKVLAQRGKDILLVGDDLNGTGVVYNRALDDVTEPTLVQSILGRGYWTEPTLGTAQEQQAVRRVEREGKLQGVEFGLEFLRHGLGNGQFEHVLELGVGLGGHGDAKLVEGADQGAVRGEDVPGAFGPVGVVDIGVDVHGYVWHEHKAFDASQPRDDHGRWTEGGGGGTSDTAAPDKTMDAAAIRAEEDRASAALDKPNTAPNYFKGDISRDLAKRLAGNPAWKDYVARQQMALRPGETRDQHAASGMLSMWAGTAGDSNVLSVAMQKAINEEFNLKARTDHMPMNGPTVQKVYDDNGTAYRAFARAMYDNTQEELSKDGIKDLTLYRGVKFRDPAYAREAGFRTDAQPHEVTISQQPASSWSYSFRTAYKFSGGAVIPGALMAATVPANRVLSTMKTGMGCKDEQEVIVLGSADDRVAAQGWGSAGNRYNVPSSPAALIHTKIRWLDLEAKAFDESQPRDEGGKWTSGGGTATATRDINDSLTGMKYPRVSPGEFLRDANERDRGGEGSAALVTPNGDLHDIKRAEHPNVKRRQVKDGVDKEEVDRQIEILATERETNVRIYAKPTYAQLDTLNDIHTLAPDRDLHYDMVTPTAVVSGKWGDNARGSSWDRFSAQLQQHYGVQLNKTARPAAEEKYREDQARDHGRFATEGGGSTVSVTDEDRAEIDRRVTQAVGHKLSDEQLAALVGAPEGSKISIVPNRSRYDPNTVVIMATHPDIEDQAVALLRPEHQGQRMVTPYIGNTPATYEDITVPTELHYEQVFLTPEARGSGTGVKMLADSVEAAHQAGIDKVTMTAVGAGPKGRFPDHPGASGGENGYYVWPRLGFDGPVEKAGISAEPEKWPEPFKSATNVSDLLRLPGGAQHWKDYGDEIPLSMDTHPDSPGRQVMDAYVKQRGL